MTSNQRPSPDRAALVERIKGIIAPMCECYTWPNCEHEAEAARLAEAVVAHAVEAAGWGPPVEPLTVGEIEGLAATGVAGYFSGGIEPWHSDRERERWHRATEAVLAALPERHRRIVLGVSGE